MCHEMLIPSVTEGPDEGESGAEPREVISALEFDIHSQIPKGGEHNGGICHVPSGRNQEGFKQLNESVMLIKTPGITGKLVPGCARVGQEARSAASQRKSVAKLLGVSW